MTDLSDVAVARTVLENNDFKVAETGDGNLRISKVTDSSSIRDSKEEVDEAQEILDTAFGDSSPTVEFPIPGGSEGKMVALVDWGERGESLCIRHVTIDTVADESGVFVTARGQNRFVTYDELVEMAITDDPVTVR